MVENELDKICENYVVSCVYDPFGGTGTTPLVAAQRGIKSYYSETNPFMANVIDTKINSVRNIRASENSISILKDFYQKLNESNFEMEVVDTWDGFEKFYNTDSMSKILFLKKKIFEIEDTDVKKILMVLLSSITVKSSLMIRRGDLRKAKKGEKKESDFDVFTNFLDKVKQAIEDIDNPTNNIMCGSTLAADDARLIDLKNEIDCVITSPPYLNGTNYIRNTKLELKLNDYVVTESELPDYHSKGIIAGINNVSKRKNNCEILPCVKPYYEKLLATQYDSRIEKMVVGYFYDMNSVIEKLKTAMKNESFLIMDIGDSQFAGVHIPTHDILSTICKNHGFKKYSEDIIRQRISKNGMKLTQRIMRFRLFKENDDEIIFEKQAEKFVEDLPYKKEPYCGRNWGHEWHSLCSYHGKLKPSIAYHLVKQFTKPGDVVLDPLSGVGTIPFEACLQGRIGIGNDLSEMAFVVTKAKVEKPNLDEVLLDLNKLKVFINENKDAVSSDTLPYSDFGFNGKLPSYFHIETYKEIICARNYFKDRLKTLTSSEAMIFSAFLHVLHGNRPYALSRNSHPLTPYAPTGDFVYKNVIDHIYEKIEKTYDCIDFDNYIPGKAIFGDYKDIHLPECSVDEIICSPPFADSIRFYMQNWMRLWLCGWEPEDFTNAKDIFLDDKQKKNFDLYDSFFEMCYRVLKQNGKVILHLGKTKNVDMAEQLSKVASKYFNEICRGEEDVSDIEKHGVRDKGSTVRHQYLFLKKN